MGQGGKGEEIDNGYLFHCVMPDCGAEQYAVHTEGVNEELVHTCSACNSTYTLVFSGDELFFEDVPIQIDCIMDHESEEDEDSER